MNDTYDMNKLFKQTGNDYLIGYCERLGLNTNVERKWITRLGKRAAIEAYVNAVFARVVLGE